MKTGKAGRVLQTLLVGIALVFLAGTASLAAIEFDVAAIKAEITAAVAVGEQPVIASKNAVVNAVRVIVAANPDYPGGVAALNAAILETLANIKITGLDDVDLFVAANHALGITVNPELAAYEAPSAGGLENARNRGGNAYGPGGKPKPASGI